MVESNGSAAVGMVFKPETPIRQEMTAARVMQRVEAQEKKRMDEGKRGLKELPEKGVQFGRDNAKKPEDIISQIPGWQNDRQTRKYVQEAQALYRDIEITKAEIRAEALQNSQSIDEAKIASDAEARVLTKRIQAKMAPPEEQKPPSQTGESAKKEPTPGEQKKEPEQEGEKEKKDETGEEDLEDKLSPEEKALKEATEKAEQERIKSAVDAWIEEGSKPEMARLALDTIAADTAVAMAEKKIRDINAAFSAAKGDRKVQDDLREKYDHAEKVLEKAEEMRSQLLKKNEQARRDTSAPVEQRLLAYDIELTQNATNLNNLEAQINALKMKAAITPEENRQSDQAKLEELEAKRDTLAAKHKLLNSERSQIGTPEQRLVNYLAVEVSSMVSGMPLPQLEVQEGVEPDPVAVQKHEAQMQKKRDEEIKADPLGYLQNQIDQGGLKTILENSGLSESDQKKLLSIATAQTANRSVYLNERKDDALLKGRQGLLALLLMLYTAHGANKKAKSGQMG